jgi:hypothetical protein
MNDRKRLLADVVEFVRLAIGKTHVSCSQASYILDPDNASRSQPFLSDGAFERRKPVLDLANPALELFERAGHVQQPLNEVIREGFEGLGDRSSPPPRCLLSDHAESFFLRRGGMASLTMLDTQHIDVTSMGHVRSAHRCANVAGLDGVRKLGDVRLQRAS